MAVAQRGEGKGEGKSKTRRKERKRGWYSLVIIQDQFRHTNSQNTFQEIVNEEMTVCEYGL